jgi:hypothetical protein
VRKREADAMTAPTAKPARIARRKSAPSRLGFDALAGSKTVGSAGGFTRAPDHFRQTGPAECCIRTGDDTRTHRFLPRERLPGRSFCAKATIAWTSRSVKTRQSFRFRCGSGIFPSLTHRRSVSAWTPARQAASEIVCNRASTIRTPGLRQHRARYCMAYPDCYRKSDPLSLPAA